jgi:hypothetical protein
MFLLITCSEHNMSHQQSDSNIVNQSMTGVNGDAKQVGNNEINDTDTNTNSNNIFVPIFLISILALGGLAWALVVGVNKNGQNPQSTQQLQPTSLPTKQP